MGKFFEQFSFKVELYDPLDRNVPKNNDQTIKTDFLKSKILTMPGIKT